MPSCAERLRSATTFALSTAGLVVMTALYSTAGGFLFQWLEKDRELLELAAVRRAVDAARAEHVQLLWNLTESLNVLYKSNWTAEAESVLGDFQQRIYEATTVSKWDGKRTDEELSPKWNLPGALLYAVTAITTIGYGHVTPLTTSGRVATMLYALLGIPLTIMCMANLGKVFAKLFRLVYHALCCGLCCFCCTYRRTVTRVFRPVPRGDRSDSGVNLNGSARNGHSLKDAAIDSGGDSGGTNGHAHGRVSSTASEGEARDAEANPVSDLCEEKVDEALGDEATVPVYLCLIVMASYICAGAVIFGLWENWGFVAGAYFCFVTLTTIGFGDYIPGLTISSEHDDWVSTQKLILCVIYVFFGLALIAMCFDLMRETVTAKAIWLATRLGFVKNDDEGQPQQ